MGDVEGVMRIAHGIADFEDPVRVELLEQRVVADLGLEKGATGGALACVIGAVEACGIDLVEG
ncbi:hypothetical protein [Sphingomonas lutea]|uniref:hypothetical protein n=1 Tax=Sphingomonas lutea TaxID=1045317 RepID=UPI001FD12184|nr:hypothetical protein [Sphingomonas lutea]